MAFEKMSTSRCQVIWPSIMFLVSMSYYNSFKQFSHCFTLSPSTPSTDSVGIFNQLGQTYLQLGYTGKAGLSWSQAKMIMESAYCQTDNRLLWMLGYCRYMSSIGHVDKRLK